MNTFNNLDISTAVLFLATLLTGLSAGLCFTWTNAITTGVGRLDDSDYLQAFQHMNRTILNPLFFLVFFGPILLSIGSVYFNWMNHASIIWLLVAAAVLYFFGVFIVTVVGNVPLNELLDKTNIPNSTDEELTSLREMFENKWNNLHLIRTICSLLSFILMLISCLFKPALCITIPNA